MTGNFPVGDPVPPAYGPVFPPPPKPSRAGVWLGSIACVLAAVALVVGVVALLTAAQRELPTPRAQDNDPVSAELLIPEVDKALCKEIGPLLKEETDRASDFVTTAPESAERRAAIPKFKRDTVDWYRRAQSALNRHRKPDRYLTRTVQNYIDGALLYSENLHADRGPDPYDNDAYESAIIFVGGPLAACYKLGEGW